MIHGSARKVVNPPFGTFLKWFVAVTLFLATQALFPTLLGAEQLEDDSVAELAVLWLPIYLLTLLLCVAFYRSAIRVVASNPGMVALVALALCSYIWSDIPGLTARRGIALLFTTLFAFTISTLLSATTLRKIITVVLCASLVISVVVILTLPEVGIDTYRGNHWRGVFGTKNEFARIAVYAALPFLVHPRRSRVSTHIRRLVMLGLCALLVVLGGSATGIALLFVMSAFALVLPKLIRASSGVLGICVALLALFVTPALNVSRTVSEYLVQLLGRDPSATGRTELWLLSFESVTERPFLGFGFDAFWAASGEGTKIRNMLQWNPPHSHNGYLDLALSVGFVGLILFSIISFVILTRSLVLIREGVTEVWFWLYSILLTLAYNVSESTLMVRHSFFWILFVLSCVQVNSMWSIYKQTNRPGFASAQTIEVSEKGTPIFGLE